MKPVMTKETFQRVTKANQIIEDREQLVSKYGYSPWETMKTPIGTLSFCSHNGIFMFLETEKEKRRVKSLPANIRIQIAEILAAKGNEFFDAYLDEPSAEPRR